MAILQAASSSLFAQANTEALGLINVKHLPDPAPSAVGDGKTDDTAAIQAAAELAKKRTIALIPDGGAYLGTSPAIYFPAGRYLISDEIQLTGYTNVMSDSRAIIEQKSPDKRTFVFENVYTISVKGLKFIGGKNQIWMGNKNIDSTMLDISECEFQLSQDYAIFTQGSSKPNDQHMSANLMINRCKFIRPKRVLRNVCDYAAVRDTWVTIHHSNFDRDTAAFMNTSGQLMFDNMIGVPVFGMIEASGRQNLETTADHVRWVDNHGSFFAQKTRFGGEFGGIPILHQFGLPEAKYPKMGSTVAIENSTICAGPKSRKDSAVITLREGIPQLLRIVGNNYLIEGDFLLVDGFNMQSFARANPDARSRINFEIDWNMAFPPLPPGSAVPVPAELKQFLKTGRER